MAAKEERAANLSGLVVRDVMPEDGPSFVKAFDETSGAATNPQQALEHFRWQYVDVPDKHLWGRIALPEQDAGPGGTLGAIYLMVPRRLSVDGEPWLVAHSQDTLTMPDWRKRGIFVHLAKETYAQAAEDGCDLVYGFPNVHSQRGFFKNLSWLPLPPLDVYATPTLAGLAAGRVGLTSPLPRMRVPVGGRLSRVEVVKAEFGAAEAEALWQRVDKAGRVLAVRDAAWLKWRFEQRPGHDYRCFAARDEDGQWLASAAMVVVQRSVRTILVMDLLAAPGADAALALLLRGATEHLAARAGAAVAIVRLSPRSPWRRAALLAGFLPPPKRFVNPSWAGFYPLSERARALAERPDSWAFSYADADAV